MSCHQIGRAMGSVAAVTLNLYDQKQIEYDPCMRILIACARGINYCDGNTYEEYDGMVNEGRCGWCLEKGKELGNLFEIYDGDNATYRIIHEWWRTKLAHPYLCPECLEKFRQALPNKA